MRRLSRPSALALLVALATPALVVVPACGGLGAGGDDDDNNDDGNDDGNDDEDGADPDAAARTAVTAQAQPAVLTDQQLKVCVGAVVAATQLAAANNIVVTGTVDARGQNPSYSAAPDDALVLRTPQFDLRFVVTRMLLSNVSDISEVFVNDHDVACRSTRDGSHDVTMRSALSGRAGNRSAEGTLEVLGRTVDFSFTETNAATPDIDGSLAQYEVNTSRSGTATGDALDVSWQEDERYVVLVSQEAFENRTTEIVFDARVDGFTFDMADGVVKRSFRNGFPAEPDFWSQTSGTLQEDGAAFGELSFRVGAQGAFEVVLTTPDGVEVLETYAP